LFMKKGFSLIELMIVIAIIGIVISIAVPAFIRARRVSQARACQANLRNIAGGVSQWALENQADDVSQVSWDELLEPPSGISDPYLNSRPSCPAGGEYILPDNDTSLACTSGIVGHNLESARLPISEWTTEDISSAD